MMVMIMKHPISQLVLVMFFTDNIAGLIEYKHTDYDEGGFDEDSVAVEVLFTF